MSLLPKRQTAYRKARDRRNRRMVYGKYQSSDSRQTVLPRKRRERPVFFRHPKSLKKGRRQSASPLIVFLQEERFKLPRPQRSLHRCKRQPHPLPSAQPFPFLQDGRQYGIIVGMYAPVFCGTSFATSAAMPNAMEGCWP